MEDTPYKQTIALVGPKRSGKTSIVLQLVESSFEKDRVPTVGMFLSELLLTINSYAINTFLNDIEDMVDDAETVCIVFDCSKYENNNSIISWIHLFENNKKNHKYSLVLVANYSDLISPERQLEIIQSVQSLHYPLFFCSSLDHLSVTQLFHFICEQYFIHKNIQISILPPNDCNAFSDQSRKNSISSVIRRLSRHSINSEEPLVSSLAPTVPHWWERLFCCMPSRNTKSRSTSVCV
ncbi:hypothetical protein WA158_007822 [Blastocystis sp. Blastoise]